MSKPRRGYFAMTTTTITLYLSLILWVTFQTHFWVCNGVSLLDLNSLELGGGGGAGGVGRSGCSSGKIGECLGEFEMDSEINRRVLAMGKRYISYETLRRDMVPCGRPGAPYYNCHVGPVNPYSRGCEAITGCRGTIKDINT